MSGIMRIEFPSKQRRNRIFRFLIILLCVFPAAKVFASGEGTGESVWGTWSQSNYEGGIHLGQAWISNIPGKTDGGLSIFPYVYVDGGLYWPLTDSWRTGFKLGVGFDLSDSSSMPFMNGGALWENKWAVPIYGPDDYGRSRYFYIGLEIGWTYNLVNYDAPLPPGIETGTNPQSYSWGAPSVRFSFSAYYVEAAYQVIFPIRSGQPTGSILTLGFRLMVH